MESDDMNTIKWWHRININGIVTPGANAESEDTFNNLGLPEDMTGLTVLDIGAWDGYYSFRCEDRGATVTASDKYVWVYPDQYGFGTGDAGFNYAHKALNSKVKKLVASVEELDPNQVGKFDIVLMLGVLYHAKDPIGYLEKARSLSNDLVCIETHVDLLDLPYPAARYYEGKELNNDPSNFWGPNPLAVRAMMTDIGYKNIKEVTLNTKRMIFVANV